MFDISFPELAVVALLALLVFGPQELGRIMYGLGRVVRRLQYVRFALSQQFEDFMQRAGGTDLAEQVNFEAGRHLAHSEGAKSAEAENGPEGEDESGESERLEDAALTAETKQ